MANSATLIALYNLIVAKIRDKGNGLPTSPKEVRETLDPIVAALPATDEAKDTINALIFAMIPDNNSKLIDPYELRDVLYAIVAALSTSSSGSSNPFISRPYVILDPDNNLPPVLPNIPYADYIKPYGTTINQIIAEISNDYNIGLINYGGDIINNETDGVLATFDIPQGQGILWMRLSLKSEQPPNVLLEFLSTEFLSTEFL